VPLSPSSISSTVGTGQEAVTLSGWEDNRGPSGK